MAAVAAGKADIMDCAAFGYAPSLRRCVPWPSEGMVFGWDEARSHIAEYRGILTAGHTLQP